MKYENSMFAITASDCLCYSDSCNILSTSNHRSSLLWPIHNKLSHHTKLGEIKQGEIK